MEDGKIGDSLVGVSTPAGSRKTTYGSAIDSRLASQDLFLFRGLAGLFRQAWGDIQESELCWLFQWDGFFLFHVRSNTQLLHSIGFTGNSLKIGKQ